VICRQTPGHTVAECVPNNVYGPTVEGFNQRRDIRRQVMQGKAFERPRALPNPTQVKGDSSETRLGEPSTQIIEVPPAPAEGRQKHDAVL
jgi:hypothetical protein